MQVRELTVKDVFTITQMLGKVKMPEKSGDAQGYGLSIIMAALSGAEDEIKTWLADMAGVSKAEFEAMPPTAILDVAEAISRQESARDFFDRLLRLLGVNSSRSDTAGQTTSSSGSVSADTFNSRGSS